MARAVSTVSLAEIVGGKVVTAEGKKVGHIVEIRVSPGPEYRVQSLLLGRYGWLDRFDLLRSARSHLPRNPDPHIIPWDAVDRLEPNKVVLKPGRE